MRVAVPLEQCWHEVPGGTARTSIDLVEALVAHTETEVIGVAARHRRPPEPAWRTDVPIRHHRLPRPVLYETWHALRRPRVESLTGAVDLVHCTGGAVAATAAPLVVTVHDLAFLHHPEMFTRHGLRFFRRALELTKREAAAVVVPSDATRRDCEAAGIEPSRLHVVPWGIEVVWPSDEQVAAVHRRLGVEGPYVVVVGTLEPRKNLLGLLEAWRLLARDDVALLVVGPSGWGDALGDRALPQGVELIGFVDRATRDALYRGAAASVYPSLFEGFGLPVLESMALGCPVVTSAGTSTEELVAGGAGITVDPTDPASICAGLRSVLDHDDERERLRHAGLERASGYTWERTATEIAAIHRDVVA